jgi:DNA-binding transcriptional LysR family regulator
MNTVSGITDITDWPEGRRPSTVVHCENFDEWLELVAAEKGVGVVPELVLRRQLHPAVRFIPLVDAPPVPLTLMHPLQGAHPLARRFTDMAKEAFADHHVRPVPRPLEMAGRTLSRTRMPKSSVERFKSHAGR